MLSIYALKSRFQSILRPLAHALVEWGVTANAVTVMTALISCLLGAFLIACALGNNHAVFLWLPLWMFVRMALNAIDGLMAREHGQASILGAYLNELGDIVADTALYLPFAFIVPFTWPAVCLVIFLAALSEFTGVLGLCFGADRRHDGPMGKSDRALCFGALGLTHGLLGQLPAWMCWIMPTLALLLAATIANRIRGGLRNASI